MPEPAGDSLIEGLAAGRADAFAALYDRHGAELFRVARSMLGSAQDAEDAVQEVFVGLVRARSCLGKVENLRGYLFAALRRAVARLSAEHKSRPCGSELEAHDPVQAESPALEIEQAVRLERALAELPWQQREVIALKIEGGLTFAEIAGVLGLSANTAASRYRYALDKLRAALEESRV